MNDFFTNISIDNLAAVNIASKNSTSTITGLQEGDVQQNAVDIRIDRVWEVIEDTIFTISEELKVPFLKKEIIPSSEGFFILEKGFYEISFENIITMGPDEGGYVITRSTLNRNGAFITSGWYDSGYQGGMIASLHITGGKTEIARGTRIGQFLCFKAEALSQYDGSYGFAKDGTIKKDEQRYHK